MWSGPCKFYTVIYKSLISCEGRSHTNEVLPERSSIGLLVCVFILNMISSLTHQIPLVFRVPFFFVFLIFKGQFRLEYEALSISAPPLIRWTTDLHPVNNEQHTCSWTTNEHTLVRINTPAALRPRVQRPLMLWAPGPCDQPPGLSDTHSPT